MAMRLPAVAVGIALLAACAAMPRAGLVTAPEAARALPVQGPVQVGWDDPAGFSELRLSGNPAQAARGDWVRALAEHLRHGASRRLAPGQRLDVHILDIRRAGLYEPWRDPRAQDIRILRDNAPPRLRLRFALYDADGRTLAAGERALVDPAFLSRPHLRGDGDPLRHEKTMLDHWLERELRPAAAADRPLPNPGRPEPAKAPGPRMRAVPASSALP